MPRSGRDDTPVAARELWRLRGVARLEPEHEIAAGERQDRHEYCTPHVDIVAQNDPARIAYIWAPSRSEIPSRWSIQPADTWLKTGPDRRG